MENDNQVTLFLKNIAGINGYKIFDNKCGNITYNTTSSKFDILLNSGSVYGIWVKLDDLSKERLWKETKITVNKNTNINIKSINELIELTNSWFPLYWGKDLQGAQRIFAHIKGHKNNGNINMPQYTTLKELEIIYGSIAISNYAKFEKLLMKNHPALLGTSRVGSTSNTEY
ncbi:hypothetical protein J2T13_004618 [Paenibacillus sp. DS2015]|uniref:hypothetical protein n=1 Tax=Paenibacillus sp. DS2015 TaxID=3373917 RepID=UPI003D1E2344